MLTILLAALRALLISRGSFVAENLVLRRELTDHVLVLSELHLLRLLTQYIQYYNATRTHLSLNKDSPLGKATTGPEHGRVVSIPLVGGLHHRYERRAA